MTKSMEDALNLPRLSDVLKNMSPNKNIENSNDEEISSEEITESLKDMNEIVHKIDAMNITDFTKNERTFNQLQEMAIQAHKDCMDAGLDVEARNAGNFLDPAMTGLNIAMEIERSKVERKLKLLRLELEKEKNELYRRKLELEEKKHNSIEPEKTITNETTRVTNAELMEMLKNIKKNV